MRTKQQASSFFMLTNTNDNALEYASNRNSSKKRLQSKKDSTISHFNMHTIEHESNKQQNTYETKHNTASSVRNKVDNNNIEHDYIIQRRNIESKTTK